LLALILMAFGRLVWRLDSKSLWWDESLSLQRAESPWPALLAGRFAFDDGVRQIFTTDQHPFAFFALLGALIRLAGESEFVLRFPSVFAATLLVPMLWAFARLLAQKRLLPGATPLWAALFAAVSPFFLWYGREARMYTIVSLLGLLSTYLLLRWREASQEPNARRYLVAYVLATALLLSTHFLSVVLLPIHAGLLLTHWWPNNRRRAILIAVGTTTLGLLFGIVAAAVSLNAPGSGVNFRPVSLSIMAFDLLNAFSLGLSVDTAQVRWLDYTFGMVALVGALWCWRHPKSRPPDAWLLPALLLLPIIALQAVQLVQPAYMNARHMSLVSGAFVLLISGGVAAIWNWRVWAGAMVAMLLLAGTLYSSYNYFVSPVYAKDDFAELGAELDREIQPGDAVVFVPYQMLRLYRYYLPLDADPQIAWLGAPLIDASPQENEEQLESLLNRHRRIWLVVSGMVPFNPLRHLAEDWLRSNAWLARESGYESNTVLRLMLFLPEMPILDDVPDSVQHPTDVVFDGRVRLRGYEVGQPLTPESPIPITLYWQPVQPMDRRYKYVLRLQSDDNASGTKTLSITEREPYDSSLPTTQWPSGQTILEYTSLPPVPRDRTADKQLHLALQVYDAETLAKLPVTQADGAEVSDDGLTLLLPYER
jgi:4-amino-4-deoxy-L-arabinose transferase-like glycosyltransferase